MSLLIFLTIAVALLAGIHGYLWLRLVRAPALPHPWAKIATVALIALAAAIPASLLTARASHSGRFLIWPAFTWLGVMFLLFVFLLGTDTLRVAVWLVNRLRGDAAIDPGRRLFIARSVAGGALATAAGLGISALHSALGAVSIRRVDVPLRRLDPRLDGLALAQLTDLHIGPTIRRADLLEIVNRTNELAADIVAITGDLVDGSVADLREQVAPLGLLRARYGVYFVTGNHEYFSGATAWVEEISRLGIRVLRNERITIEKNGAVLDLAGVDDRSAARFPSEGHGEDLAGALGGRDPARALVLLAHQPRTVLDAARFGVDLQLSGHTHGGQIWPFGALVRLQQRFLAGLGRQGETMIYVSRGTGYWGPPMRLRAPSEIAHLVLRSPAARPPSSV